MNEFSKLLALRGGEIFRNGNCKFMDGGVNFILPFCIFILSAFIFS